MTRYVIRHSGTEKQMEFWQSPSRFRGFIGGLGSGKTRAGLVEVLRQPPVMGAVVAPIYRMLKDTIIPTVEDVAGDLVESINRTDMWVQFKNGTKMLMRSADEPDTLRGPNLGWFWLDEPAQMPEMIWKVMLGRIRLAPGRAWVTGTPAGKNWLYKKFVMEAKDDPEFHLIQSSSHENVFLPEYYLHEMDKQYQGAFHRQEVSGEFVEWVDEPAYPGFQKARNVVSGLFEREYRTDLPLVVSCDFNHRIMSWPISQVVRGEPKVYREVTIEGNAQVRAMCRKFRQLFPSHPAGLVFYGDASGGSGSSTSDTSAWDQIFEEFANYASEVTFMVPKRNPGEKARISAMNDALSGANGYWALQIDESCEILINDLERVEMNSTGTGVMKIHKKPEEDERALLTHSSDAAGYWIHMEWPTADVHEQMREAVRSLQDSDQFHVKHGRRRQIEPDTLLYGL